MQRDEATRIAMTIDQPLVPIETVDFDEVPLYGSQRISDVLDRAHELGVPTDLVDEAKMLAQRVCMRQTGPRPGQHWDWGRDPSETFERAAREDAQKYNKNKQTFRDFLRENFLSAGALEGSRSFTVTVPIFVVGSPEAKNSRVSMKCTASKEGDVGFELKLFGTGLGANKKCKVTVTGEHVCEDGNGRRGDLNVPFLAVPFGYRLSTGPKILWWNTVKDDSKHGELIIADCKNHQLDELSGAQNGDDVNLLSTDAITKLDRSVESGNVWDFSVGAAMGHDIAGKIKVSLGASQEVQLSVELPGRFKYRSYQPAEGMGGIWKAFK
jgi:hypothetical protein